VLASVEVALRAPLSPRFFFLVANTLKMSFKNSSSSLSAVVLSLTCKMCDLITSLDSASGSVVGVEVRRRISCEDRARLRRSQGGGSLRS